MTNGNFGGGKGTMVEPYLVEDVEDFIAMGFNKTAFFRQTQDIDFADVNDWIPIVELDETNAMPFMGGYDGNFFKLENLTYISQNPHASIFGTPMQAKYIKNIIVSNFHIETSGESYANIFTGFGGTADYKGIFENCKIENSKTIGRYSAPFHTGLYNVEFKKCAVKNHYTKGEFAGLFGVWENGEMEDCYIEGELHNYTTTENWNKLYSIGYGETTMKNVLVLAKIYNEIRYQETDEHKWSMDDYALLTFPKYAENAKTAVYMDIENYSAQAYWSVDRSYYGYNHGTYVRGQDKQLYTIKNRDQMNKDYNYWEPAWDNTGPPEWYPPPFYRAEPGVGELWQEYWEPVLGHPKYREARTTAQLLTKSNYENWDFENVWLWEEGKYPQLRFPSPRKFIKCIRKPLRKNFRRISQ